MINNFSLKIITKEIFNYFKGYKLRIKFKLKLYLS